jgi:Mn2+/Fe2+ NRAMP family transporter
LEKIAAGDITPGMLVETTDGDLGEQDMSKPKVAAVVADADNNVETVIVEKGMLFKKQIEVPVTRIDTVAPEPGDGPGTVTVTASEAETDALAPTGPEALAHRQADPPDSRDSLLEQTEEAIPTDVGLRELERRNDYRPGAAPVPGTQDKPNVLRVLGPGFLSGMAGNDSSAVTSYAVDGARAGFGHLWLMLLSTPLLFAVQFACARIGRIQQKGLGVILRENYSGRVAGGAALILVLANVGLIAADLVAIGSGLELITGLRWIWFIVPVAAALWYITVYQNFDVIKRVFLLMSLAFVTYIITGVMAHPDWGTVLSNTLIPHLDFGFASISAAVALLGATVSPYTMFWQVQGEKEEQRPGRLHEKVRWAAIDIGAGVISGNLVAYFIIVATAGTLFTQHKQITSAVDAAKALEPLLGEAAKYLFALGLIGAGLIAIPVLLASASYGVAGTFGWPSSLSKKPWQNEGFYLILTGALVIGLIIAVLGFDPIQLMFWVNVLQGVLSPVLVVLLILVGNNRKIMGVQRFGLAQNAGLAVTALVMFSATALLFYGLLTGQGG